jgi:hypothetical protein
MTFSIVKKIKQQSRAYWYRIVPFFYSGYDLYQSLPEIHPVYKEIMRDNVISSQHQFFI